MLNENELNDIGSILSGEGNEMATDSSILACEIPWTEKPGGLQSMKSQESDNDLDLNNNSSNNLKTFRISHDIFRYF